MAKTILFIRGILLTVTAVFLAALIYGFYAVPDEIISVREKPANVSFVYTLTYEESKLREKIQSQEKGDTYDVNVSFLKILPVKNSSLTVSERDYVAISGELVGLRLFTEGIIIVGIDEVKTAKGNISPARKAGLQKGDVIISIDNVKVKSCNEVSEIIEKSSGRVMKIECSRKGKTFETGNLGKRIKVYRIHFCDYDNADYLASCRNASVRKRDEHSGKRDVFFELTILC